MNPEKQQFYAIDKKLYFDLEKAENLVNKNEIEGKYCIEVWKYNPDILSDFTETDSAAVDPLSLYLSMRDIEDERIDMAFDKIIETYTW